jgi:hypothetical protein
MPWPFLGRGGSGGKWLKGSCISNLVWGSIVIYLPNNPPLPSPYFLSFSLHARTFDPRFPAPFVPFSRTRSHPTVAKGEAVLEGEAAMEEVAASVEAQDEVEPEEEVSRCFV